MAILSVNNISKSFERHKVLDGVSLNIETPGIVALVGPNGSGKSTFLDIIANILNEDSGTVQILGKSNKDISVYKDYSYMIDNTVLYEYLTGLDHLKFICEIHKLSKDSIRKAVELMGIKHFINKKVGEYSLGMKQQLLFTMSILNDPDFIVLDEPFNGLDPSTIIKVRKIILDFERQGKTILLSSHNLAEVDEMTSHIVFIKDGKFIEEDISKYQEDIYYFKVKNPKETSDKLNNPEFKLKSDEIIVSTENYKLNDIIDKINTVDEIIDIRKETKGAEKRYEELYNL